MRIEPLCDIEMVQHGAGVWLKPYGAKEAAGYARGDGKVSGARDRGSPGGIGPDDRRHT